MDKVVHAFCKPNRAVFDRPNHDVCRDLLKRVNRPGKEPANLAVVPNLRSPLRYSIQVVVRAALGFRHGVGSGRICDIGQVVRFHVAGKRRRIHGLGEPHIFYFQSLCVEISYLLGSAERLVDPLCHGALRVVDLPIPPPVVDLAGSLTVFPDAVLEKLRRRVIVGPRLIQKGPIRLAGNIQESLCPLPRLIANENSFQQRSNIVFADLRSCAGHVAHDIFRVRGRVRQHGEIPPLLQALAQRRRNLIRNILIDIVKCRLLRRFRCGVLICV